MEKDNPLYEQARRAYAWTSFDPERRAVSEIKYFEATCAELKALGADTVKFERLFVLSLAAKSRCASAMITGPANFPTERNRRANDRERKITDEMLAYVERVKKAIDKQNNPQNYAISSDNENALQLLKDKLEKLQQAQTTMKLANKIIKDKQLMKLERLEALLGSKEAAEKIMKPDFCNRIGFASYSLTNNNANIKTTAARIAQLEKAADRVTKEMMYGEIKVIENAEENRIQFFFPGKPPYETIILMKSRGFKWSPTQGCWQRLWNGNAVYSAREILKQLTQKEVAVTKSFALSGEAVNEKIAKVIIKAETA